MEFGEEAFHFESEEGLFYFSGCSFVLEEDDFAVEVFSLLHYLLVLAEAFFYYLDCSSAYS